MFQMQREDYKEMDLCLLVSTNCYPHSHLHTKGVEMSLWPLRLTCFTHSLLSSTGLMDVFVLPLPAYWFVAVNFCPQCHLKTMQAI